MAKAQRHRVLVTLSPEAHQVIEAMAKASGEGKATIIRGLVDEALPVLSRVAKAMVNLAQVTEGKAADIRRRLEAAAVEAETDANRALLLLERLGREAAPGGRVAGGRGVSPDLPPLR